MTEKQLQSAIIEAINYSGLAWVWNVNAGMIETAKGYRVQLAQPGASDIQGITKHGRFVALEVKLPKRVKTVTEKQQLFIDRILQMGGIAAVVTDPEQALRTIEDMYDN